jgi:hypothetical protein
MFALPDADRNLARQPFLEELMRTAIAILVVLLSLVGCAGTVVEKDRPSRDLSGRWAFQVATGKSLTNGVMTLVRSGSEYGGTLTTDQGDNLLKVRSAGLEVSELSVVVESPNGEVTFKGVVSADGRSFLGTVTYFNGQRFPMAGARR